METKVDHGIRGVLFDLNGVLVNASYFYRMALMESVYIYTGVSISHADIIKHNDATTMDVLVRMVRSGLLPNIDRIILDKIVSEKRDRMIEVVMAHCKPITSVRRAIKHVRNLGLRSAVVTNGTKRETEAMLQKSELTHLFDAVITRSDLPKGKSKPHPLAYLEGAWTLGLNPHECLAFDDSTKGVMSALNAKCRVHRIKKFGELTPQLIDKTLESLRIRL